MSDRRAAIHAANPDCATCGTRVHSIKNSVIKGEEVQRLVHVRCFLREVLQVNPSLSTRRAHERARLAS
jgi:predicted amino acid dehydrogenase